MLYISIELLLTWNSAKGEIKWAKNEPYVGRFHVFDKVIRGWL